MGKEGFVPEERLKLAVFIDFDNIQIGVKDTLGKEFDVSLVLEELKERGEVVTKVAYGDWPRAGEQSRQMTQHAVQMVQRNVTPRGDKNGADINLALDALEMAFTRHHINAFAVVGGDSDFIALVEKLKQYDKRVFVVGGRAFTSNILQRNCTEFIAYENLLKSSASAAESARPPRSARRGEPARVAAPEVRPLGEALPNIQRALQILAERGVAPQLGLLKSTILQLDSTFSERDYGVGSFLEFMQKMAHEKLVTLRRTDRGYLVETEDTETPKGAAAAEPPAEETSAAAGAVTAEVPPAAEEAPAAGSEPSLNLTGAMEVLKQGVAAASEKSPNRPLYMRQVRQGMRSVDPNFDERKYGFRGILDLLHQAQREGWIRLQRDHRGVWRIFPISQAATAAASSAAVPASTPPPSSPGAPIQAEAAASTDFWASADTADLEDAGETLETRPADEYPASEPESVLEEAFPEPVVEAAPVVSEPGFAAEIAKPAPAVGEGAALAAAGNPAEAATPVAGTEVRGESRSGRKTRKARAPRAGAAAGATAPRAAARKHTSRRKPKPPAEK